MSPCVSPILQQPITKRHPNLTNFYNYSVVLWVLEDAEPICHPSVVIKKLKTSILGFSYNHEP